MEIHKQQSGIEMRVISIHGYVGNRNLFAPPTLDLNMWLCGRKTDLSVIRVRVGVAWALKWAWQTYFGSIDRY